MSVKLTNFVKLKINHHMQIVSIGDYSTAALIHYYSAAATANDRTITAIPDYTGETAYLEGIRDYIAAFFNNGGKRLHIVTLNTLTNINTTLDGLPMEQVVVGFVNDASNDPMATEAQFNAIASAWNTAKEDEKIYQKIFVAELPFGAGLADFNDYGTAENKTVSIENYVIKYGAQGIGASVLAYFSAIDVFASGAAQDYGFTTENYSEASGANYVFNDNDIIEKVISLDMNADTRLVGRVRNVGGNDTAGYDLTNQFMLLVLHQVVTNAVLQAIVSKIKYNDSGLAIIKNAIVNQLKRFVSNGYLTTNKVWEDADLSYEGYKIINNNTVLNQGYSITILPFESLTAEERAAHQLPKIFILIADSYSIRKVVIDGEVF